MVAIMDEFKNILVPVDDSDTAARAFEKALQLARAVKGQITLVNVIPPLTRGQYKIKSPQDIEMHEAAMLLLTGYTDKVKDEGIGMDTEVKYGLPSDEILGMAGRFDLIVMGNKGHNPLSSLIMGSVAEKVVRDACVPVMLVGDGCK